MTDHHDSRSSSHGICLRRRRRDSPLPMSMRLSRLLIDHSDPCPHSMVYYLFGGRCEAARGIAPGNRIGPAIDGLHADHRHVPGVISIYRIPVEFLPPMDLPFIICQIPYIGATPEQVEKGSSDSRGGRIPNAFQPQTHSHHVRLERRDHPHDFRNGHERDNGDCRRARPNGAPQTRIADEIENIFLRRFNLS